MTRKTEPDEGMTLRGRVALQVGLIFFVLLSLGGTEAQLGAPSAGASGEGSDRAPSGPLSGAGLGDATPLASPDGGSPLEATAPSEAPATPMAALPPRAAPPRQAALFP